jgi:hypothetical protein
MIRSTLRVLLLVTLLLNMGCAAWNFDKANRQLNELQGQLRQGADAEVRAELGNLATRALASARKLNARPDEAVPWYRVAAVASVEAGPQGENPLFPSVDGGKMACDRLPQQDASLPRDCGLIRLALPVGVAKDLAGDLTEMNTRRGGGQLPASDLLAVTKLYDGFEVQADKVGHIRAAMTAPVVPAELKTTAENQRRVIYCWALKSYSLAFDVEGTTPQNLAALTARKTALRTRTEGELGPIHCDELAAQPNL